MSNKIKIYGQLESGIPGGSVTDVTQIAGFEAALSAATAAIKTAASADYDSASGKIVFKDKDGSTMFNLDAAPFVKDGMLEKAELKDGNITFTFNTDSGKQPLTIPVTDIFNPENYYNKTQIDEIAADIKTTEAVAIAGGPLADDVSGYSGFPATWKAADGSIQVPANCTLQELVTVLFLQVVNGSVSWSASTWSPSISNATVTVKNGSTAISAKTTLEVGSSLTVSHSGGGTITQGSWGYSLTAANGYFLKNADGTYSAWKSTSSEPLTSNGTVSVVKDSVSTSSKWNGTEVTSGSTVTVAENKNTYAVTKSGPQLKMSAAAQITAYAATNTKQLAKGTAGQVYNDSGDPISATNATGSVQTKDLSNTAKNEYVYGSYKYYIGYADSVPTTTDAVKALTTYSGWVSSTANNSTYGTQRSSISIDKGTVAKGKYMVVAVPAEYSLTSWKNEFGQEEHNGTTANSFTVNSSFEYVLANGTKKTYKLYYRNFAASTNYASLVISK